MNDTKKLIKTITLGIRLNRSFRIPEISGEIIDDILYGNKSPFGTEYFPETVSGTDEGKILQNQETGNRLHVNRDGIILFINIGKDFDAEINFIKDKIFPYFEKILFPNFSLKQVQRIGFVFSHEVEIKDKILNGIKTIINNSAEIINLNLTFSQKLAVPLALAVKGTEDYIQANYIFREMSKDKMLADLDYQYYWAPPIANLDKCNIEKRLTDALAFREAEFAKLLKSDSDASQHE